MEKNLTGRCTMITSRWIGLEIERCNGEMVDIESENPAVKTRFCSKCGHIENFFTDEIREQLMKKAQRYKKDE